MRFHRISAVAAVLLLTPAASGQVYVERLYDPPVGSRWQIVARTDTQENRETSRRDQHIMMRAELTVTDKLPNGFRIAYVTRAIDGSGSSPGTDIALTAFQAMKDIQVRARTDRSGKPVAIENLDEVRAKVRTVIDTMTAAFRTKPQLAAVMKEMLEAMLMVDGAEAARLYIEDVPTLASVQNTGLKPNESARSFDEVPSPLGGKLRSAVVTTLTAYDAGKGTAQYHRTREFDKEALQAFVLAMVRKIQPAANNQITPEMVELMKQIRFTMTADSVFSLEGGMTRNVVENSTIDVNLMGHTFTKVEKKTVVVTPLPNN